MKTMYRAGFSYKFRIDCVEVVKETDKTVTFIDCGFYGNSRYERRSSKETRSEKWFDSWEDAHAFLIQKASEKLEYSLSNAERAKEMLNEVLEMKEQAA